MSSLQLALDTNRTNNVDWLESKLYRFGQGAKRQSSRFLPTTLSNPSAWFSNSGPRVATTPLRSVYLVDVPISAATQSGPQEFTHLGFGEPFKLIDPDVFSEFPDFTMWPQARVISSSFQELYPSDVPLEAQAPSNDYLLLQESLTKILKTYPIFAHLSAILELTLSTLAFSGRLPLRVGVTSDDSVIFEFRKGNSIAILDFYAEGNFVFLRESEGERDISEFPPQKVSRVFRLLEEAGF